MKERTIVPDLLDCQADEKNTLIAIRVAAIEHHPHDCLGVCGCGDRGRESFAFRERAFELLDEHHK
jgi:hypothetical protein